MTQGYQAKSGTRKAPKLAGSNINLDGNDLHDDNDDDEDEEQDLSGSLMEVVNIHPGVVRFSIDGRRHKMKEGDVIKLPATYVTPVQYRPQGDPLPSVIERLTNHKVLPIVDPRVQKDKAGVPMATIKAKAAALVKPAQAGV